MLNKYSRIVTNEDLYNLAIEIADYSAKFSIENTTVEEYEAIIKLIMFELNKEVVFSTFEIL